ncbi:MAG: type II toxin-antitoxin system RelE family toxin [Candidatus Methylomirabilales bacterium]
MRGRGWRGVFKLRAGAYRVLFTVSRERRIVSVHRVGHRRNIYRTR